MTMPPPLLQLPVPDWQVEELARRKAAFQKNPDCSLTWDEVKQRITQLRWSRTSSSFLKPRRSSEIFTVGTRGASELIPNTVPSDRTPGPDTEFRRGLGLFDATMVVVGSMIGSGIFIVSADMAPAHRQSRLAAGRLARHRRC